MKKALLFSLLALFLCAALPVMAQTPGLYAQINGGTNNVAAATTNSYASTTLSVGDYEYFGVQFSATGGSAGSTNSATLVCYRLTGDEWDTDPLFRLPLVLQGTNRVTSSTNILAPATAAIGKWKVEWPTATGYVTNHAVKVRLLRKVINAK